MCKFSAVLKNLKKGARQFQKAAQTTLPWQDGFFINLSSVFIIAEILDKL